MIEEKPRGGGRLYALSRDAMKEHSREGERRREMRGERGLLRPPLDPPRFVSSGARVQVFPLRSTPALIRKADAHKPFALQYGFETWMRRVNRGDRCLPTWRGLGSRRCLLHRRLLGSRRLRDNGMQEHSREGEQRRRIQAAQSALS